MKNAAATWSELARPEIQDFLLTHENKDEHELLLQQKEFAGVPMASLANQLICRRKAKYKLPTWYQTRGIVYPPTLNLEQSSSESTANHKLRIIEGLSVKTLADLTGGFGIDSFYFSFAATVTVVEPNQELCDLAKHNHQLLGASLVYHVKTAEQFLETTDEFFELIYLDPSRRSKTLQKVFRLADCEPAIPELLPALFLHTNYILLKAAPLLDIQQGLRELRCVKEVHVVSVDNECKELLFLLQKEFSGEPLIRCVHLGSRPDDIKQHEDFTFRFSEERSQAVQYSSPLRYLYEPNASVLKGGAFKSVGHAFTLKKLQASTHLYTSDEICDSFPGRTFEVIEHVKPDKKLANKFPAAHANVLLRNYPLKVNELLKKTGLKEGGEEYLIGCSSEKEKHLMIARKIK